jgi:hypothetical protein
VANRLLNNSPTHSSRREKEKRISCIMGITTIMKGFRKGKIFAYRSRTALLNLGLE